MPSLFSSPAVIFSLAALMRVGLLFYGLYQDNHSAMKYTDIDYMVFTDASHFMAEGQSPYLRDTYRYTPLLAWFLIPTTWEPNWLWFSFGKVLFAIADLVTGWLLLLVLRTEFPGMSEKARLSTRGSSEGLLGVMVIALLWAVLNRHIVFASVLLGLGVHFKIYPFIYAPSIIWFLSATNTPSTSLVKRLLNFITFERVKVTVISLLIFIGLNVWMYSLYGHSFLQHTYFHHVTRIDHRHNFSPYNTLLYLSAATDDIDAASRGIKFESVAFLPQLFLSAFAIPLALAKKSLPGAMLAQTFAFVTFNKVCTSQYFLWYLVFLPLYLPSSSFMSNPILGIGALIMWILSQAFWLHQGFQLEFMGLSTFLPGLWLASLGFFIVNCWILGIIVSDVGKWPAKALQTKREDARTVTQKDK
ncbi:uncharacterized protein BHQ10_001184 [Talaromyces amestolkiae]|uniref:GPI mannosyltransferase 1 n=1 Tax=Talaromyces amestolkiae TaxID=1196081 RepID=A0A364KNP6_TALAM|nr:uncharacterized protein BHQ10_001184 [Talaromyces amestolkiae]RAO65172.1 hypothetical protein BHQ10_001184 [Talaromyces amestolkiae]